MADNSIPTYRCIMTNAGAALEARARITGKAVLLTHLAVGDGAGDVPEPQPDVTGLVREQHRRGIGYTYVDPDNPCIVWTETVLPADIGGWWIREVGLYAETENGPVLFAYANHAPYHKTLSGDGQATEHIIKVPIIVSSADIVSVVVRTSGYATKTEVRALRHELYALFAGLPTQIIRLTDRATVLELTNAANGITPAVLTDVLPPDGVQYAPGVKIAPLTIVQAGSGGAPSNAAVRAVVSDYRT